MEGYDKQNYNYDLYAVCNHMGNVNGGHYTAHVKNMNGRWYNFNDMSVSPIDTNVQDKYKIKLRLLSFYRKKSYSKYI